MNDLGDSASVHFCDSRGKRNNGTRTGAAIHQLIRIYIYIYIYAPLSKFLTSILYQQNLQEFSTYLSISSYTHLALLV